MQLIRMAAPLLGLVSLCVCAAQPASAQNLLANGSFEQGTFVNSGTGGYPLPVGSTVITGWTVSNAELAWLENGNSYGLETPFGSYFLDLTGYHDSLPYGGVAQTIATTPGAQYVLSFDIGADQSAGTYGGPMSVAASAGSTAGSFTFTAPVGSLGNYWGEFDLPFTATGASTAITLTGTSSAGGQYLGLDNVSVTAAPEPSQSAALGIGFLSLGAMVLRARKRRVA